MTASNDPPRLADAGDALASALVDARSELPDAHDLASLAAKLGPLLGGGGGGGGGGGTAGAGTAASTLTANKIAVAVLAAAALVAGVVAIERASDDSPTETPALPDDAPAPVPPPAAPPDPSIPPEAEAPPEREALPEPRDPSRPRSTPAEEPAVVDPALELRLLEEAQDALATDPVTALARTEEHARRFPSGALVQEREVLAIDALLRLGRRPEAESRATGFRARHAGSSQLRRIESLLAR